MTWGRGCRLLQRRWPGAARRGHRPAPLTKARCSFSHPVLASLRAELAKERYTGRRGHQPRGRQRTATTNSWVRGARRKPPLAFPAFAPHSSVRSAPELPSAPTTRDACPVTASARPRPKGPAAASAACQDGQTFRGALGGSGAPGSGGHRASQLYNHSFWRLWGSEQSSLHSN